MKARNSALCFTVLLTLLQAPLLSAAAKSTSTTPANEEQDLLRLFRKVDHHFDRIQTMDLRVSRVLERGLRQQKDQWRVLFEKPDQILLNYEGPPQRLVLSRGDHYSEYIPEAKKALELNFSEMSDEQKKNVVAQLMPRVAIPGFRLALDERQYEQMQFQLKKHLSLDGRACSYIEGVQKTPVKTKSALPESHSPLSKRMLLWIDEERATLARVEVYDGNQFISSIESKNFKELEPGLWLPSQIVVKNSTPAGIEKATYQIPRLVVNQPLAKDAFMVTYGEGVTIVKGADQAPPAEGPNVKTP